jgi:hypothetical protein
LVASCAELRYTRSIASSSAVLGAPDADADADASPPSPPAPPISTSEDGASLMLAVALREPGTRLTMMDEFFGMR